MKFLTDRKRAAGLGAGGTGTHHHWHEIVTSIALVALVPLAIFTFGFGIGGTQEEFVSYFGHPFVVIIMAVCLVVGIYHFMGETVVAIEDYVGGDARALAIIAVTAFCYILMGVGLFALLLLAL